MNELAKRNAIRRRQVESYRDQSVATHGVQSFPRFSEYPLFLLKARIANELSDRWGKGLLDLQLDLISRDMFGGDLALKVPQLLTQEGPKGFIQNHLPWIVDVLRGQAFVDAIAAVQTKGMYINITVSNRWLLESAQTVADLGSQFGISEVEADRTIVVDYSSPNIAKILHAGHIRSTIIGHVLSNLHEACGALVYRINHINDFGGFGFALEGYRRFKDLFPKEMSDNERLLEIYRIRRTLERLVDGNTPFEKMSDSDRAVLLRYFPDITDREGLKVAFEDFVVASDARFAALEAGEAEEVDLWARMVEWSLEDFEHFYASMNIHIDLVLGESFYFHAGDDLIDQCLKSGTAILYTEPAAKTDLADVDAMLIRKEITEDEHDKRAEAIRKDIGAVVVPLDNGERLVVRRADGLSIYATRDLGAILMRRQLFDPTDMIYVVGQEQQVHFARLFRAACVVGIARPGQPRFKHVYFGFYVDARTGRKLSSRDSVANVGQLLTESIKHFRMKSAERSDLTNEELESTARQLAIGSLVFNDLKQDVRGPVEIDTTALNATIASFEKSGGAYVVYAACRARSILRKYGGELPRAQTLVDASIDGQEATLLLRIQQLPEVLLMAAEQSNPTFLIRHLLEIATVYNSYYMRVRVITDGVADPVRLLITKAVEQSLINGLRVCHVECPAKI